MRYRHSPRPLTSRQFLGVTMVPFRAKARVAFTVICAYGYYAAAVGINKVVISSDDVFKERFERDDHLQRKVAMVLRDLNVIDQNSFDEFDTSVKTKLTDKARERMKQRATDLEDAMQTFGIALTEDQQVQINAMLKIEAA